MPNAVVGTLRALLTMDTASFQAESKKASAAAVTLDKNLGELGKEAARLAPQAERMVKAFAGEKLLTQANNLTAAVTKLGGAGGTLAGAAKLTETEQARVNRTITEALAKYSALGQTAPKALTDLAHATKQAEPPTSFLTTKMVALGAAVGTFASQLALQAIRSLVGFGRQAFTTASHLVDLSNKTGLSTDTIQRMQFVADQTGTTLEAMTDAAFRLGVRLDGGGRSVVAAVEKLGLSWQTLRQQRPEQQFEAIISALGRVESTTERNRLGQELFGRSFITIAASIAEGYDKISSAANVASRQQLESLDRAADRWSQFVTNTKTNVTAFLGQLLLMSDAMPDVEEGQERTTQTASRRIDNLIEAQRRLTLGLVNGRRADIALSGEAAAANESYVQKLREVNAELAKLTAADRAEIDAALQLGVSTDDLEDKYGLTAGALRILTSNTKAYDSALKDVAKSSDAAATAHRAFLNFIGEREIQDAETALRAQADALTDQEAAERAHRQLLNQIGEQEIKDIEAGLKDRAKLDADYQKLLSDTENARGVAILEAEGKRMAERGAIWKSFADTAGRTLETLNTAVAGSFAQMALGAKNFKEGFLDIWESIKQGVIRIFADIAGAFITGMLKKMAAAAAGTAVAGAATGAAVGAGTAAATGAAAAGTGAAAAGGLAGLGGAAVALATNPFTIAAAAGIGAFFLGKKLFSGGEEAKEVNPRRDLFTAQFGGPHALATKLTSLSGQPGGGPLYRALVTADTVNEFEPAEKAILAFLTNKGMRGFKMFNMGGFVPPGVVQPAILHGGAFGEDITPRTRPQAAPSVNTLHLTINAIDAKGVRDFVESRDFGDALDRAFFHNKGFIATRIGASLAR